MPIRRIATWLLAGILTVGCTVLAFFPAARLAQPLETATHGRLTLLDATGTIWSGSAVLGAATRANEPATALLPGRFAWKLSPLVLFGRVDLQLENPAVLMQPATLTGGWREWQLAAGTLVLPVNGLAALGAPFNTLALSGKMRLSWQPLQLARDGNRIGVNGLMRMELDDITSRLYPMKTLGAYWMTFDWRGQEAELALATARGPLLLSGAGRIENGRLRFSGKAEAEAGQEEALANLLNLLGRRRNENGKTVIGLEFN
ncbi:MAG: type II secretion system protein N [Burkholderiaceae bacterium]|nr:type II secretion system protein N [Burkholderiaceae bacterium]